MSTPMFDLPEHCPIGINRNGDGPIDVDAPDYYVTVCWCDHGEFCVVYPPVIEKPEETL